MNEFNNAKNNKIIDFHSHTYYSNCGRDNPHDVIKTAIKSGVNVLGISDHHYGIGDRKKQYVSEISELAQQYKKDIAIVCGIEIATFPHLFYDGLFNEVKDFSYCLIEHITEKESVVKGNLFEFCDKLKITCGIAHTDLFLYCDIYGYDYKWFFTQMAERGIFWEMNVNYDSVHQYRQHEYVKEFVSNDKKRKIIKESGVCISVGFDGHRHEEYKGDIVRNMNDFLHRENINTLEKHKILKNIING